MRVAYEVYRGAKIRYGQIPGVLGRSEFGLEIVLAVAYQPSLFTRNGGVAA